MKRNEALLSHWNLMYKTVYNAIYIGEMINTLPTQLPIFKKIAKVCCPEYLQKIASHIHKIVDFEEFAQTNHFSVKHGVDHELDEMKRTYNGLPDFMTIVAKEQLKSLNEDIKECNVNYLPQLGYLLVIPATENMVEEGNYEQPGMEFKFVAGGLVYYKNEATLELDKQLGDTQSDIQDRETSIMHQLQDIILTHTQSLLQLVDHAAELDCLLALAIAAREYNLVCPEMTANNVMEIKAGRHPIQEHLSSPFVPNDFTSGEGHSCVKLLTGPNASGKSVYLKQVALIVYMAHIGSYVPAKSARISLTDRIFTRVSSRESVTTGLSTFMIDLNQVSTAVRCSTERSLIILDEFGKGTETVDGMSLLIATIRHWLNLNERCPHCVVSTHFHSVVQENHLPQTPLLEYQTMDAMLEEGGEELVFLYQLVSGSASHSYACHVAATAGLPAEVLTRGREVSDLLRREQPVHRVDTPSTETQFARCKNIVDKFLQLDLRSDNIEDFLQDYVLRIIDGNGT